MSRALAVDTTVSDSILAICDSFEGYKRTGMELAPQAVESVLKILQTTSRAVRELEGVKAERDELLAIARDLDLVALAEAGHFDRVAEVRLAPERPSNVVAFSSRQSVAIEIGGGAS